jgi:hypothetical protein
VFSCLAGLVLVLLPFIITFIHDRLGYLYNGLDVFFRSLKGFTVSDIERVIMWNRTLAIRYEQLLFAVEHQDKIPLIGIGIGKAVLMPESFYAMYYYRTGLIGISIHIGLLLYSIYWSLFFAKKYAWIKTGESKMLFNVFMAIAIYFISFFLNYFSSAINDQTRTGFIFYTLIAILVYYKNHYRWFVI